MALVGLVTPQTALTRQIRGALGFLMLRHIAGLVAYYVTRPSVVSYLDRRPPQSEMS